jgi:excisionase family DNA binding protein
MARRRERAGGEERAPAGPPIPLAPVDLLAGIAPGVELHADGIPPGIASADEPADATMSVAEAGRLLRCGDATIRRLIRTAVLRPVEAAGDIRFRRQDVEDLARAGVVPRTPQRPGE